MKFEQDYIQDFIKTLQFQEFKSANTLESYTRDLDAFYGFCKATNDEKLSEKIVFEYLNYIVTKKHFSARSQSRTISCLKKFCNFLVQKNIADLNYATNLELPKKPKDLPKAINHEVLQKIINDNSLAEYSEKLARTILIVFYATGLRISELINLTVSDLEENQAKALKVKGKGGKFRLVPLGTIATEVLTNHLNEIKKDERYANSDLHFIFPSIKKSKDGKYKNVTRQYVYTIIHKLGLKYGIEISPHKLRHSFATELVKNNADLRTVQLMLGHSDLATTQIYTKIADEQAYNALLANHPLAKK
ncbi:MAG TPA: hypothetical protein DCL21_00255 [Alphaproteobacteria bacterium]|nr:hypothetical protein [Alphaproteobacteria bacterium]